MFLLSFPNALDLQARRYWADWFAGSLAGCRGELRWYLKHVGVPAVEVRPRFVDFTCEKRHAHSLRDGGGRVGSALEADGVRLRRRQLKTWESCF